jgi:hypothetical protein
MWVCVNCAEKHEDSFSECWNCGASRQETASGAAASAARQPGEGEPFKPEEGIRTGEVRYDPAVIQRYAQTLYAEAWMAVVSYTLMGTFPGLLVALLARSIDFGVALGMLAALVGCIVGYMFGAQRAFTLRLQAQMALCQVAIERNTRRSARTAKDVRAPA